MSKREQERAQGTLPIQVTVAGLDITTWNGVPVSPAVAKADGLSPDVTVPEVGAILQAVNTQTGNLDRARIVPANTSPGASDPALVVASSPNAVYPIGYANTTAIDAFARLRVGMPSVLFDTTLQYQDGGLFWSSESTGTGAFVYQQNQSACDLTVSATGDKVIRQTKEYFVYEPGISQLAIFTSTIGASAPGIRRRIGYFDGQNGIFFELGADGTLYTVLRSSSSGIVTENRVPQSAWNVDKLDSTGPSGMDLDTAKANIYWVDLEWLGVGRVRMGVFSPAGIPVVAQQYENANANATTYMTTASLPLRYEIENVSGGAGSWSLKQICATVVAEAGGGKVGYDFASYSTASMSVVQAGGIAPPSGIIGLRPRATFAGVTNRVKIVPESFDLLVSGNNAVAWKLLYNPAWTPAVAWANADATYSASEVAMGPSSVTGGIVIASGFAAQGQGSNAKVASQTSTSFKYPIALDINGLNPDMIVLAAYGLGGSATVYASINWREYR